MSAILLAVLSTALELVSFVARPARAACPRGWYMPVGVRTDGAFTCAPPLVGGEDDARPAFSGELSGRVWCRKGERPRQDGTRAWCASGAGA